ncbi:MAG: hypothetical protein FRX49_13132 [Trebouxia sp. A1-2]|nr:MAG: hypothetical protein FRX49_13132 [Trebouxia sp. A1-2]
MAGHESHKRPEQTLVAAPKIAITQSQLLCPGSFSLQSPMVATPSSTSTGWTGRDLSTVTWPQQQAAIAKGKPALREQGVQPQGLLPVALSLQIKENLSAHQAFSTQNDLVGTDQTNQA